MVLGVLEWFEFFRSGSGGRPGVMLGRLAAVLGRSGAVLGLSAVFLCRLVLAREGLRSSRVTILGCICVFFFRS